MLNRTTEPLPVHGFVLAGGKSSRMGVDKALLEFCGVPMVEIAVGKLRDVCAEVSIVGDRDDLAGVAPVVGGERTEAGPAAGVEAGLRAARCEWAMFVPVDVPLVPADLLRRWAEAVLREVGCAGSLLLVNGRRQPGFSMLRREALEAVSRSLDDGMRRLNDVLMQVEADGVGRVWVADVGRLGPQGASTEAEREFWFCNVNTPEERVEAELWARARI